MSSSPSSPPPVRRYVVDNVAALVQVMHRDRHYALAVRDKAEQQVTLRLRRKFVGTPPELVVDAFNTAFLRFLKTQGFRSEAFLQGQSAEGWSADELVEVLGGYLYTASLRQLVSMWRVTRREQEIDESSPEIEDPSPRGGDPAWLYEQKQLRERVIACMDKLSETLLGTFRLFLEGVALADIASRLDTQVGTVKSRLDAARKLVINCARKGM